MKVVLFCGGEGLRIRDHSGPLPKPMVCVGYRPILWHLMKYYAHYGHTDFVLCLGHGADHIKRYFVDYDETVTNDFVLTGGDRVALLQSDLDDWRITFVDTGLAASVGERLLAVRPYLDGDEWFVASYADCLTDVAFDDVVGFAQGSGRAATFLGVRPNYSSHVVHADPGGAVRAMTDVSDVGLRINGGFFVLHRRVFDFVRPGEDLIGAPTDRMIAAGELGTYAYDGFWACMDTFKEKRLLEDMHRAGAAPWEVWGGREVGGDGALERATLSKGTDDA